MQNDLAKPGLQNEENNDNGPPDGFTLFVAPDDEQYLIPSFLIEATKFAFHHKDTTEELRPDTAAGGPYEYSGISCNDLAEGEIQVPVDPAFSDREALSLHAEVMALQRTLGISYKDAAHRLYMAELERLKAERRAEQAFSALRERVDKTVFQEIYPPIIQIDAGNFDSTVPEVPPPGDK